MKSNSIKMRTLSLKIKQQITEWNRPVVMGILNATPDSFYAKSRIAKSEYLPKRIAEIIESGADIIDIGGISTRPDSADVDIETEWARIKPALQFLKTNYPHFPVSVDTFRSEIARRSVTDYGVDIINDVSGGQLDSEMISIIGKLNIAYVAMHMRGNPATMQQLTIYNNLIVDIIQYFSELDNKCKQAGIVDFIIDPGFGFAKNLEQNYRLLNNLDSFLILELPIMVGISRKSMIYKLLDTSPEDSLIGTAVLHTIALQKGAQIIRVHDVKEAIQTVKIVEKTLNAIS